MSEEIEELLGRLTPRRADPGLRAQVLAAVDREIAGVRDSRWPRRLGLAVAASILLGLGLNVWASRTTEQRLARLFGPPPVSKQAAEIAATITSVTDEQTGRWAYERLAAAGPPRDVSRKYAAAIKQLIEELQHPLKDTHHAKAQEDSPVDRDRGRGADRDTSDRQRGLRLDYRYTA